MVGSQAGGDGLQEDGVPLRRGIELEGVVGVGDADDPLAELEEPEDEPPADGAAAADHDAGTPPRAGAGRPTVADRRHLRSRQIGSLVRGLMMAGK